MSDYSVLATANFPNISALQQAKVIGQIFGKFFANFAAMLILWRIKYHDIISQLQGFEFKKQFSVCIMFTKCMKAKLIIMYTHSVCMKQ